MGQLEGQVRSISHIMDVRRGWILFSGCGTQGPGLVGGWTQSWRSFPASVVLGFRDLHQPPAGCWPLLPGNINYREKWPQVALGDGLVGYDGKFLHPKYCPAQAAQGSGAVTIPRGI